jgi:hypothetical protein
MSLLRLPRRKDNPRARQREVTAGAASFACRCAFKIFESNPAAFVYGNIVALHS